MSERGKGAKTPVCPGGTVRLALDAAGTQGRMPLARTDAAFRAREGLWLPRSPRIEYLG